MKKILMYLAAFAASFVAAGSANATQQLNHSGNATSFGHEVHFEGSAELVSETSTHLTYRITWAKTVVAGGDSWTTCYVRLFSPTGSSVANPSPLTSGSNVTVTKDRLWYLDLLGQNLSTATFRFLAANAVNGVPDTYKVTFTIPANDTDRLVRYEVWQSGAYTGQSLSRDPGDPSIVHTFTGLASDSVATLREVRTNLVQVVNPDGSVYWTVGPSDLVRVVNGGTTPVISTGSSASQATVPGPAAVVPGQPAPPPRTTPQPPSPAIVIPGAPTSTTPGVAPTPKPPPNVTPAGTGGATKEDIERQTNQLTDVINEVPAAVVASGNKVVTAVDALSAKNHEGQSALISAINASNSEATKQANASLILDTSRNDHLAKLNEKTESIVTNTSATVSGLTAVKNAIEAQGTGAAATITAAQAAAAASGSSSASSLSGAISAAQSAAAGVGNGLTTGSGGLVGIVSVAGMTPILGDNGYATTQHIIPMTDAGPILSGAAPMGLDTNPFTSPVLGSLVGAGTNLALVTWARRIIEFFAITSFLGWVAHTVYQNCVAMGSIQPLPLTPSAQLLLGTSVGGTSVGVVPAGALYAVSVVAFSTLILAAPVIIVSALAGAGQVPVLVERAAAAATGAAGAGSGGGSGAFLANSFSFIYLILPVATLVTIALNTLLVRVASITQWVITVVVIKIVSA